MMYQLLSSTRYDEYLLSLDWNDDREGPSPFFLLPYHFDRLLSAAEQHNWLKASQSLSYERLRNTCREAVSAQPKEASKAFKLRITLSEAGELDVGISSVVPFEADPTTLARFNPIPDSLPGGTSAATVRLDSKSTLSSLFTCTKTTHRIVYNEARSRVGVSSPTTEVLLFNDACAITEASISNVYFFRSGSWVTPSASTGCLPGVLRRWLLAKGFVREDNENLLTKESVVDGEWVLLSNGVQGCRLGRVSMARVTGV